jgi:hypothetical protein
MLQQYAFSFYEVVCRLEAMREVARISELAGSSYSSKVPNYTREELLECPSVDTQNRPVMDT